MGLGIAMTSGVCMKDRPAGASVRPTFWLTMAAQPLAAGDQMTGAGPFVSGPVVFIHDDAKMAQGQPCTSVHRYEAGKGVGEEIVAFHCKPRWGKAPGQFTKAVNTTPDGLRIMTEYQFAGDEEAHGVPKSAQ